MGQLPDLNSEGWGWYLHGRHLPVISDGAAAPTELLEVVSVQLQDGMCNQTMHLQETCSTACGQFGGVCTNARTVDNNDEDEDDSSDN